MFPFHFTTFAGKLDIQFPDYEGIPNDSPVFIIYRQPSDLSKHEILRRFYKLLKDNGISYLRPIEKLTQEWNFNLREFKQSFECLKPVDYLKGSITIEPEYIQEFNDIELVNDTYLKFSIYKDELELLSAYNRGNTPKELTKSLRRFRTDYPDYSKCGFLMMKFEDTKIQKEIVDVIKSHFSEKGITILRADEKWYADDLLENITTYMEGCSFGIALFDRINTNDFNPNVSLEIGYMLAMDKPVLLLKDKTLKSLHTDLVGKLYHIFDFQNPLVTIPLVLDKWIIDKEIITE